MAMYGKSIPQGGADRLTGVRNAALGVGAAVAIAAMVSLKPHAPDLSRIIEAPTVIQVHLTAALTALVIGSVLMLRVKGTALHKALGWTWVIAMGTTAVSSFFIHANGGTKTLPRPAAEVDKELAIHGISVVEVKKNGSNWATVKDSAFNFRITTLTDIDLSGPARGNALMVTKYSTDGTRTRGTLNNCGTGKTPWGTLLTGEENWNGYFFRSEQDFHGWFRILAAEDNPVNRLVLEQMLIQEGATVDFGFDGAQALELVNRHGADAYDIVLCDIQMPVMDGFETTLALARIAPDLPVIGLTAHAFETARTHAREVGMVDYVTKPYLLDTLVEVVLKHTKAQTTSQTPDTQSNQDQLKNDPAYPDWVAMQEHFGSNPQLLNKLIQTLREAGRGILTNMDAAMAQRDFAKLKSEAHSLKGAALNLHTPGLAKQAAELQNLAALQAPLAFTLGKEVSAAFSHFLDYLEQSPH